MTCFACSLAPEQSSTRYPERSSLRESNRSLIGIDRQEISQSVELSTDRSSYPRVLLLKYGW